MRVLDGREALHLRRIDGVQLAQEAPQRAGQAGGRGPAQQRPARQQRIGQHAGVRVGEADLRHRH